MVLWNRKRLKIILLGDFLVMLDFIFFILIDTRYEFNLNECLIGFVKQIQIIKTY